MGSGWNVGNLGTFGFAGGHGYQSEKDSELQLLGHRYYLPILGRFLTQDPIGHEGGFNLYAYCSNNPLGNIDSDGTQDEPVDSMRSLHPGMHRGTARSNTARQMKDDLVSTLIWAAFDGLSHGAGKIFSFGFSAAIAGPARTATALGSRVALSEIAKKRLRAEALRIWARRTGTRAGSMIPRLQIHHRIPLEWSHLFPGYPNRGENLIGVTQATHDQISATWTVFRNRWRGSTPTSSDILQQAIATDEQFSPQMTFLPGGTK